MIIVSMGLSVGLFDRNGRVGFRRLTRDRRARRNLYRARRLFGADPRRGRSATESGKLCLRGRAVIDNGRVDSQRDAMRPGRWRGGAGRALAGDLIRRHRLFTGRRRSRSRVRIFPAGEAASR